MRKLMRWIAVAVFLFAAVMLVRDALSSRRERAAYAALAQEMHAAEQAASVSSPTPGGQPAAPAQADAPAQPADPGERAILPQFVSLHERNEDMAGWLTMEAIGVDHPVMYTPEDQNYYSHAAFNHELNVGGALFLGVPWGDETRHSIIYGHNLTDGSMFGQLKLYEDEAFGRAHPVITFYTLYEKREYTLVCAYIGQVYHADDTENFHYYAYPDLSDPEKFTEFVNGVMDLALYTLEPAPEYGDELLTLSTCEKATGSSPGRFVLLAKRIS